MRATRSSRGPASQGKARPPAVWPFGRLTLHGHSRSEVVHSASSGCRIRRHSELRTEMTRLFGTSVSRSSIAAPDFGGRHDLPSAPSPVPGAGTTSRAVSHPFSVLGSARRARSCPCSVARSTAQTMPRSFSVVRLTSQARPAPFPAICSRSRVRGRRCLVLRATSGAK